MTYSSLIPSDDLPKSSEDILKAAPNAEQSGQQQLARENEILQRLHEVSARLISEDALPPLLQAVLEAAITLTSADMGTLQLYDSTSLSLHIVAHQGLPAAFLEHFSVVKADGAAVCGQTLRHGKRIVVEDVAQSPIFQGTPAAEILAAANVRAVQSTPMLARNGQLLGMIATHWTKPHSPDETTLRILDLLAREAADLIEHRRREEALRESKQRLKDETEALARLNEASSRLWRLQSLEEGLNEMLSATLQLLGADMGNVQVLNAEHGVLNIVAQSGFDADFLAFFREVSVNDDSACGRTLRSMQRTVIEDIDSEPSYAPYLNIAHAAGYRAVQSTPLISPDGALLGMLSTHFRSPHRLSDTELHALDLYARLAADFIYRKQAEEALQSADRRKNEFLATLAHELRNPLAPISNALYLLRGSIGQDIAAKANLLEMMERQTAHLVRLVDDLLEISRITSGKIELKKERIDLATLLDYALESVQLRIQSAHHHLTVSLPHSPLVLDADKVRLTQVFANILNNAAKYTDDGGQITIRAEQREGEVVISIRDTGIGIAASMLPHVFDLFAQVDHNPDRAREGLGIGLALVRNLVELHGGRVEVHSDGLGRGSEFVVHLPLANIGLAVPVDNEKSVSPFSTQRILVVDDHKDAADSLALMLASRDHEVKVAYNGADALEIMPGFDPFVAILDLGMPGMSGHELARQIRQTPGYERLLLIALTGWGQEEDRRRTREAGFDHHLTKPAMMDELQKLFSIAGNYQVSAIQSD